MTKILVTGADGYVGSHVIDVLRTRPVEVHVVVRDEKKADAARALGLTPHHIALEETSALRALAADMSAVAHLAASEHPEFLAVSRAAVDALIAGLPAGSAFVTQGGSMVFGDTGAKMLDREPALSPPPPLAARAALDRFVLDRVQNGVRPHIVYGSFVFGGRGAMMPNALIAAARNVGYSGYIGDGASVWSAVHVIDWADLIVRVLLDGTTAGGPVFAAAQTLTLRDAATMTAAAFAPPLGLRSVSFDEASTLWGFFAPAFAISQNFDAAPAREKYGWKPQPRDIATEFATLASGTTT